MKLSCLQENLARGLGVVGRAVASRSTLPITQNVMLSSDQGMLRLSATNLEIAITTWIGAMIEEEGAITVPHRLVTDLVNSLPSDRIDLDLRGPDPDDPDAGGGSVLHISCGRSRTHINGAAADDFPPIPQVDSGFATNIDPSVLRQGIGLVAFSAASDESRPVLTGVHFRFDGDKMTLAAADGFRLAVYEMNVASELSERLEITVPARALNELERLLTDDDSAVEMYIHADRTYVRFHVRSVQMTAQLIQGNYPSYDQLIPSEYQTRAILPGAVLQGGVRSAAVFARESSGIIRLIFNGEGSDQNITLTARAEELGNHRGRVDAAIEGDDSRIAYNVRYLQDVLQIASGASSAEIAMETSGPSNPGVFRVVGRDNYVHVLMPMFVQWEDA